MIKYTINASVSYDVLIGKGLLADVGKELASRFTPRKVCIITDNTVNGLYEAEVSDALTRAGFSTTKIIFPCGEHSKNLTTYGNIIDALADESITRSDLILALGGGVVIDIAGFVAGTYMRGINYVIVPTTFQASIDTAVGGKTGVNLLNGKNLAGLYWEPSLVLIDPNVLSTLTEERIRDGYSEAVKCAVLADEGIIGKLRENDCENAISRCVSIKKSLVEADERGLGVRQMLNFGHTIGHGIEKISAYNVTHGAAVAKGMVAESLGAFRIGLTSNDISGELSDILESFGFDVSLRYDPEELIRLAYMDKKIYDGMIAMIVPERIGNCSMKKLTLDELATLIRAGLLH